MGHQKSRAWLRPVGILQRSASTRPWQLAVVVVTVVVVEVAVVVVVVVVVLVVDVMVVVQW